MLDIGDKEGTLCESNEELHRLLLERQIPHEWEVRSGGHDFTCWNTALPKAFRFINEYFNGKQSGNSESSLPNETPFIQTANATVYYPEQAQGSTRKYPIIYVQGEINEQQQKVLVSQFHQMVDENKTWPAVLCFVKANTDLSETISDIQSAFRQSVPVLSFGISLYFSQNRGGNPHDAIVAPENGISCLYRVG